MPYFKWFGYNVYQQPQAGFFLCQDQQELHKLLQQQQITGIHAQPITYRLQSPCSFAHRHQVLSELSQLLNAHIRLSDALHIMSSMVKHEYTRQALLCCMRGVDQGRSFGDIVSTLPELFDMLTQHALKAGDDSGLLLQACVQRANQMAQIAIARQKVRTALAIPVVTGTFFVAIIIFLTLVIVPQFKKIFIALKAPLPASTQFLVDCGDMLTPVHLAIGAGILAGSVVAMYGFSRTRTGKNMYDWLMLHVPIVSSIYKDFARAQCLQSLALLISSGQTLSCALDQIAPSFNNKIIYRQVKAIQMEVEKGRPFADAIKKGPLLAALDIERSLILGHETAQLAAILAQLGENYRAKALKKLDRLTGLLQPVLLILLGAAIGGVLLALYVPLLSIPTNLV